MWNVIFSINRVIEWVKDEDLNTFTLFFEEFESKFGKIKKKVSIFFNDFCRIKEKEF